MKNEHSKYMPFLAGEAEGVPYRKVEARVIRADNGETIQEMVEVDTGWNWPTQEPLTKEHLWDETCWDMENNYPTFDDEKAAWFWIQTHIKFEYQA